MNTNSRFYFVLLSALSAVGIGNIFLFPYFSAKFGSLFFLTYLIALIILGIPTLMLEFCIGESFDKNIVDIFASIKKWLSSIGWLMALNAWMIMSIFSVVLAWNIIYIFVSFGLQWKSNTRDYFLNNVAQASGGFTEFAKFSLPAFIALVIVWIIVFFCIRNGFDSMKKYFLFAMPIFLVLMLFFFYYSLTLENALHGIYFFARPNFLELLNYNIWISSFLLAALSIGACLGIMPAISRRSKAGLMLGNSIFVIIFKIFASLIIALMVFGILGFLSGKNRIGVDGLISADYGFPMITLAQALPFLKAPTLASISFFVLLLIITLFGVSALAYSLVHILTEKLNTKRRNAAIIVAGFGFLLGLLFVIKPGIYILDIVSHFSAYNLLLAMLFESIAIGWVYNSEKLSGFINKNSSIKIGGLWRFFIRFAVPLIILTIIIFQITLDFRLDYHGYPLWALLSFGIGTIVVPITIAFLLPYRVLDRK